MSKPRVRKVYQWWACEIPKYSVVVYFDNWRDAVKCSVTEWAR